jgi:branched-subunit amino acid ABC-type transport system permease component
MSMQGILPQFFSGLTEAMFLFLLAAGLSLIFGVSRIINISHGAFYALGAYLLLTASKQRALSIPEFIAVVIVGGAAIGVLGGLFEILILRRVYRGGMLVVALVTFGSLLIVEELVRIIWGADMTAVARPRGLNGAIVLGGHDLPVYSLVLIGIGFAIVVGLWLIIEKTRTGLLIRAAAIDREMLAVLGVNVPRVFTLTYAAGTCLAGMAGILAAPMVSVSPTMGSAIIIEAFAVVVIGGLGSLPGSLLGAFIVGQCEAFGILLAPQSTLVVLYLLMALILIIRPEGLLGTKAA